MIGTLTAEQVRECAQSVYMEGYSDGSVNRGAHIDETDWQAIANKLNALLGRETCIPHGEWKRISNTQEIRLMICNCGNELGTDRRDSWPFEHTVYATMPLFCPKCGRKVVVK